MEYKFLKSKTDGDGNFILLDLEIDAKLNFSQRIRAKRRFTGLFFFFFLEI